MVFNETLTMGILDILKFSHAWYVVLCSCEEIYRATGSNKVVSIYVQISIGPGFR